jgi:hypothetical protein
MIALATLAFVFQFFQKKLTVISRPDENDPPNVRKENNGDIYIGICIKFLQVYLYLINSGVIQTIFNENNIFIR